LTIVKGYGSRVSDRLVGLTEIAAQLGLSRQRVHQLSKIEDFPEPVARLSAGLIWEWADVERWARQTGRLPN
jgi:predicted DNA-binding transcriptional regulator AlpA